MNSERSRHFNAIENYGVIFGIVIMAISNWISLGMYNPVFTPIFILGLIITTLAITRAPLSDKVNSKVIFLSAGVLFFLGFLRPTIIYPDFTNIASVKAYFILEIFLLSCAVICASICLIIPEQKHRSWEVISRVVVACCILCFLLVLRISPIPKIDVFVINSLGADAFMSGINPYSTTYPDIYNGAYGYHPGYTYWPFYLLFSIIPRIFGDIRLVTISSIALTVGIIIIIGKRFFRNKYAIAVAFLLLALPANCFVIEQAWIDTLLLAGLASIAWAIVNENYWMSAIFLGFVISTKQYGIIAALPTLIIWIQLLNVKKSMMLAATTLFTSLLIILPFAANNWNGFFHNTIEMLVIIPSRDDSLSLPALIKHFYNFQLNGAILLLCYAIISIIMLVWQWKYKAYLKGWMISIALTFSWIFILGKQAFANYHQFAIELLILTIIMPRENLQSIYPSRKPYEK